MIDSCLNQIRSLENFKSALIKSVTLDSADNSVTVTVITDKPFSETERQKITEILRGAVPVKFECKVRITKLSPDEDMVREKILEILRANFKTLAVTIDKKDISVVKKEEGFDFAVSVMRGISTENIERVVVENLKKNFCGEFTGECIQNKKDASDIEIEEENENVEFEMPVRYFNISKFSILEGSEKQTVAVYLSDLNFESEKVVVCGRIEDISERNYTNGKNQEKVYYNLFINDGTATFRVTYFPRQKNIEKIQKLKVGDSIVCTGKSELFNGFIRFTANSIDYGAPPQNFVPEKRPSKPVPKYYSKVKPELFSDISQTDMFQDVSIPECLKGKTFIVFDLETTGLNSSPASGSIDSIIEIGAFKIVDGEICESFFSFINPQKKLSEEIISLTGITDAMLENAPKNEEVMPDFFKFCQGNILVGHNAANFDFKFVDYYCSKLGYTLERKIIDTIPLAQELLFLSNYKLNTIADHFKISFNHHRAIDDAYVTAKIFLELIKIKKSLPKLQ